jgi:hypothetical protein
MVRNVWTDGVQTGRPAAGAGELVEVSLVTDDYPGCPGGRVLKHWER